MSKWLFKLCNEDGLWQQLLRNKYIRDKTLGNCSKKPTDSHFWKGLMNVKTEFMRYGRFNLMDGTQIRFWEDTWLGNQPLGVRFPALFNIVRRKHDSVATVLSSIPLNVSFRRALVGNNLRSWNHIVSSLHDVKLQAGRDVFVWTLHSSGQFSVRSFYAALISNGVRVSQEIWKTKIPTKIRIFLWYLKKGVILTKDNLYRRNWKGGKKCAFCHLPETIQHLFFDCTYAKFLWRSVHILFGIAPPIDMADLFDSWSKMGTSKHNTLLLSAAAALCWAIWITRNEVVFDKCRPKTFLQVLFRGAYWLRQWAKFQRHEDRHEELVQAARHLESSALHFFHSNGWLSLRRVGVA